jgi:hypothetical protein
LKDLVITTERESLPSAPSSEAEGTAKLSNWLAWINWERSNPLNIPEAPVLHARINYAFKCALNALRHYPEISFQYAKYLSESSIVKDAENVLKQSVALAPSSLLASFSLADYYETALEGRVNDAKIVYEDLIKDLESKAVHVTSGSADDPVPLAALSLEAKELFSNLTLAYIQYMQFCRRSEVLPFLVCFHKYSSFNFASPTIGNQCCPSHLHACP